MKLYISVDMEGIAGTFNFRQEGTDRERIRRYVHNNVEWVIQGVRDSNANDSIEKITLVTSHAYGNILTYDITGLDDRIHLYNGLPQLMVPDIIDGHDLLFLVGYHPGSGSMNGIMSHTYSSHVHHAWVNGTEMNEAIFIGAIAAKHNLPVGLISGDDMLYQELKERTAISRIDGLRYVITKHSKGRFQAEHVPMNVVRQRFIETVKQVLDHKGGMKPFITFQAPYNLKVEFNTAENAEVISKLKDVQRLDGYTVEKEYGDIEELYKDFIAMIFIIKGYASSLKK